MSAPYYSDEHVDLYHGDCRSVATSLVADAIITDPPYARELLYCWEALSDIGCANLVAGGWLAAYSGQMHLPDVMRRMDSEALAYAWTVSVAYEGGGQIVNRDDVSVLSNWKPILLYRRRPFGTARGPSGQWAAGERAKFRDVLRRGGREKDLHPWAQPISESAQLVEMFSRPGDVVMDPFAGSGTVLAAAKMLGRKAIGIEADERYCEITARRLDQGVLNFAEASA